MTDSIHVRLASPLDFSIDELAKEASRITKFLLCQKDDFELDFVFSKEGKNMESCISISESIYGFEEKNYLGFGAYLSYDLDEYWELYGDRMVYDFCVIEIPRTTKNLLPIICMALAISAAKLSSETCIVDYHGFWSGKGDSVKIDDLMNIANSYFLPLDEAMVCFYNKLPLI
jgi:hypothetical protein